MEQRQTCVLYSLQRAYAFLGDNLSHVRSPALDRQRAALATVLARLTAYSTQQQGSTGGKRMMVKQLRIRRLTLHGRHLMPLRRIALEQLRDVEGIGDLFAVPHRDVPKAELVAAARAFAVAAHHYREVFLDAGLAPDFTERLLEAIQDVDDAGEGRATAQSTQVTSSAGLDRELSRGRQIVRAIDALLAPSLAEDPLRLESWRRAKRVERRNVTGGGVSDPAAGALPRGDSAAALGAAVPAWMLRPVKALGAGPSASAEPSASTGPAEE